MRNLESNLQIACVRWFRYQYPDCMIASIPNGGHRKAITASIMKAEGQLPGMPDLFIPEPRGVFYGLFIEMKAGKGKPTDHQLEVIAQLRKRGFAAAICNSFEQFEKLVNTYLDCTVKPDDIG